MEASFNQEEHELWWADTESSGQPCPSFLLDLDLPDLNETVCELTLQDGTPALALSPSEESNGEPLAPEPAALLAHVLNAANAWIAVC